MFTKSRAGDETRAEHLALTQDRGQLGDYPEILDSIRSAENRLPPIRVSSGVNMGHPCLFVEINNVVIML